MVNVQGQRVLPRAQGGLEGRNAQAMTDVSTNDAMTSLPRGRYWPVALLIFILLALTAAIGFRGQQDSPVEGVTKLAPPAVIKPAVPLPVVEPLVVKAVAPQTARALNASVPFSSLPNPAARPLKLKVTDLDLGRATDCLAAAQWYEAGDDPVGQRAVAQVVLNRVRHPAFPKTVCGVVFQGSERATGCQFTFSCDGALARTPSDAAWQRARAIARDALSGAVFGKVGNATHYHTDWVVPYWSSSLDKVSSVGTHLFFRWKGWWGTPAAFKNASPGKEPRIGLIARLSMAHATSAPNDPAQAPAFAGSIPGDPDLARITPVSAGQRFGAAEVVAVGPDGASFIIALDRSASPESYQAQALRLCGGRTRCRVLGWTDQARTPGGFPVMDGLLDAMAYSYLRDRGSNIERSLWNCDQHPRSASGQCMVDRNPMKVAFGAARVGPNAQLVSPAAQLAGSTAQLK